MANWKETINITKILEMEEQESEQAGKLLAQKLRTLKRASNPDLLDIIERFENACPDEEEFNYTLQDLYDYADEGYRIWIETVLYESEGLELTDADTKNTR